jgi:hypothetical protein
MVTPYQGCLSSQALRFLGVIYCQQLLSAFAIEDACWLITLSYMSSVGSRMLVDTSLL